MNIFIYLYEPSDFEHVLGIGSQTMVSGGNRTHDSYANSLGHTLHTRLTGRSILYVHFGYAIKQAYTHLFLLLITLLCIALTSKLSVCRIKVKSRHYVTFLDILSATVFYFFFFFLLSYHITDKQSSVSFILLYGSRRKMLLFDYLIASNLSCIAHLVRAIKLAVVVEIMNYGL